MNESSFARYVRYKRSGQSSKDKNDELAADEYLSIGMNCDCQEMTVMLIFGYTSTSLPNKSNKDSAPPATIVEFYGEDNSNPDDVQKDRETYQSKVEEYQKKGAKLVKVGKSTPMLQLSNIENKKVDMIPFFVEKKQKLASKAPL